MRPLQPRARIETETVSFRIETTRAGILKAHCDKVGVTLSEGLKQIVEQWLAEQEQPKAS